MLLPCPQASEAPHREISPESLVPSGETGEPRQGQMTPTALLVTCGSLYSDLPHKYCREIFGLNHRDVTEKWGGACKNPRMNLGRHSWYAQVLTQTSGFANLKNQGSGVLWPGNSVGCSSALFWSLKWGILLVLELSLPNPGREVSHRCPPFVESVFRLHLTTTAGHNSWKLWVLATLEQSSEMTEWIAPTSKLVPAERVSVLHTGWGINS